MLDAISNYFSSAFYRFSKISSTTKFQTSVDSITNLFVRRAFTSACAIYRSGYFCPATVLTNVENGDRLLDIVLIDIASL